MDTLKPALNYLPDPLMAVLLSALTTAALSSFGAFLPLVLAFAHLRIEPPAFAFPSDVSATQTAPYVSVARLCGPPFDDNYMNRANADRLLDMITTPITSSTSSSGTCSRQPGHVPRVLTSYEILPEKAALARETFALAQVTDVVTLVEADFLAVLMIQAGCALHMPDLKSPAQTGSSVCRVAPLGPR
jgi:hypothetical protein